MTKTVEDTTMTMSAETQRYYDDAGAATKALAGILASGDVTVYRVVSRHDPRDYRRIEYAIQSGAVSLSPRGRPVLALSVVADSAYEYDAELAARAAASLAADAGPRSVEVEISGERDLDLARTQTIVRACRARGIG